MRKAKSLAFLMMLITMAALMPTAVFATGTFEDSIVSREGVDWENLNSIFNIPDDPVFRPGVDMWKPEGDPTPPAGQSGKAVPIAKWGKSAVNPDPPYDPNVPLIIWSNKYPENVYNGDVVVFTDTFDIRGQDIQSMDLMYGADDLVIITINDKYFRNNIGAFCSFPSVGTPMKAEDIKKYLRTDGPITSSILAPSDNYAIGGPASYIRKEPISKEYHTSLDLKPTGNTIKFYVINLAYQDWIWIKNDGNPAGLQYNLKITSTTSIPEFPVTFCVVNGNGTLTAKADTNISSGAKVRQGKTVQFTASPKEGYRVKEWKLDGKVVANNTSNSYTLSNLQAAVTVTVEFEKIPTPEFPVTFCVVNGNGTLTAKADTNISSGAKVRQGKTVQFTASPEEGYRVKEWKLDGKVVANNTSNSYTLTNLQAAANVTVEYVKKDCNEDNNNAGDTDKDGNTGNDCDKYKDKVQETISVNILWHDNDYGDWKNYRPTYLTFMLKAADKEGGWTKAITLNSASFGFRWQNNWSFKITEYVPKSYVENSAYSLTGPMNPPSGYEFAITQNSRGDFTVIAKLNLSTVKPAYTAPKVPISGF